MYLCLLLISWTREVNEQCLMHLWCICWIIHACFEWTFIKRALSQRTHARALLTDVCSSDVLCPSTHDYLSIILNKQVSASGQCVLKTGMSLLLAIIQSTSKQKYIKPFFCLYNKKDYSFKPGMDRSYSILLLNRLLKNTVV